jgi:hypothetical protein
LALLSEAYCFIAAAPGCSKLATEAVCVSVTAALLPVLKALYIEEHKKTEMKRIIQYMAIQNNNG